VSPDEVSKEKQMTDRKELRQLIIDLGILLKDFQNKFKQIREELDQDTEKRIESIIRKKFNGKAKDQIVGSKHRLHRKVVKRLMREVRQETAKTDGLDFFQIIYAIRDLPERQKLDILEYTLEKVQVERIRKLHS